MTPAVIFGQAFDQIADVNSIEFPSRIERRTAPVPPQPLSLSDLEAIALRSNPTLAAAAARMNVPRGQQLQAVLYPNPVAGYHAMQIGNLGTAGQQGAFVGQKLITGGKRLLDQAVAGKEIDEAHFRFHMQEQRVLTDVRIRFFETHIAQQKVELTKELAKIGEQLASATERLIEGRQGTANDLLQAEIRADESNILLDNARNQHVEAWRRMAASVGVPTLQMTPLAGDLDADIPHHDWDSCYAMVLGSNPELNAARARVERARLAFLRARKEPIPNVDVLVSVRHDNISSDDVVNVQAGIPIPIFDKNQGNIRTARAEWVVACNEVKRIELNVQDRLATAYRRYANARQQVDRYKKRMIPKAKRSLDFVADGYEKGQVEFLTVLNSQQTYLQVSLSYLDSLLELRTAFSTIEGQLLTDNLADWH